MLQLKNATPFAANIALFPNEKGIDTLYSMVKASFTFDNAWVLTDEQQEPQLEDEYWGEPGASSIRIASDFHTGKPATDIVMIGDACAPGNHPVKQLDVSLQVGQVGKTVRVFGDREWQGGQISHPKSFTEMPIVYERAFGGRHVVSEKKFLAEERNPVGCSFKGKRSSGEMDGTALPNVEDPRDLIQYQNDNPTPAGFGFCSPDWLPRRQFAGTYDDNWQKQRVPFLPNDFNRKFLNGAHPDLIYPGYIKGGEPLIIKNMHPDGEINTNLPLVNMRCEVKQNGQSHLANLNLETLILEPNKKQISMVWKAAFECDKRALEINEIELKLTR